MPAPAPSVVYDKVKDAEYDSTQDQENYVRTGHIDDIDLTDAPDPDALVKCRDLLPPYQTALSARRPNMKLVRVRIQPEEAKFRRARFALTYSSQFTLTPTLYTIRERTFSVQKSTFLIPGKKAPVIVGFTPQGSQDKSLTITAAPAFFEVNTSARSLQVLSLMYGRPNAPVGDYVNYVNDAPWPSGDVTIGSIVLGQPRVVPSATAKPKGYWRLNQYATETRNDGTTIVEAEAVTQVIEDWSEVVASRNDRTGKFPFASLWVDGSGLGIWNMMLARDYDWGMIYPTTGDATQGVARFGPYPVAPFRQLLGF